MTSTAGTPTTNNSTTQVPPQNMESTDPSPIGRQEAYLIGGGVVICLVLAIVVAIVLWRRRPRSQPDAEVELPQDFKNRRRNSYCEVAEKPDQDKTTRNKKQKRSAHPEDPAPNGNDVVVNVDSAPDIITAHDGDSIYETIDGKRFTRNKASLSAPDNSVCPPSAESTLNRTYDHLDHYRVERNTVELSGSSDFNLLVHSATGTVNSTGGYLHKGVKAGGREQWATEAETQDDACSRRSSRNFYAASLEGQRKDTRPERRVSGLAVDRKNGSPHIKRSSLAESVSNLGSGNGRRIVCQLTMVGMVENGKPIPLQHTPAGNAYFVLEPRSDSDSEDAAGFSLAPNARFRFRDGNEELPRVQTGAAADPYFVLEPLDEQEDVISTLVQAPDHDSQRKGTSSWINPLAHVDTVSVNSTDGCMHNGVRGHNLKEKVHEAQTMSRGSHDSVHSQDLGFRSSLHGHNIVSTFRGLVKGHKQRLPFRDGRIKSCPDEYSQETASPPSTPSLPPVYPGPRDFRRSLSSPYPRPLPTSEPAKSNSSVRDRKLDPAFLQARIQQEMMALGLSAPPPSQHEHVSKKQASGDRDSRASRSHGNTSARADSDACVENKNVSCGPVSERISTSRDLSPRGDRNTNLRGAPSTNEYFILEPGADNDDSDGDTTGIVRPAPSFKFAFTPRSDERRDDKMDLSEQHILQGKHRYQRQQSHGAPPLLPRRNHPVASHTRSRSDAPCLVKSQKPCRDDEEQGPVIVSFKKSKSMPAGAPTRAEEDTGRAKPLTTEGAFRSRINSVPS